MLKSNFYNRQILVPSRILIKYMIRNTVCRTLEFTTLTNKQQWVRDVCFNRIKIYLLFALLDFAWDRLVVHVPRRFLQLLFLGLGATWSRVFEFFRGKVFTTTNIIKSNKIVNFIFLMFFPDFRAEVSKQDWEKAFLKGKDWLGKKGVPQLRPVFNWSSINDGGC